MQHLLTTIVSCDNPINASDETNITTFYKEPSSLVQHIPKHNFRIISEDMNANIGKCKNNKFCLHNLPNRNVKYLAKFSLEKEKKTKKKKTTQINQRYS